jgi:nucleoside-diphosphate kinase
MATERTLAIIKPDALAARHVGEIVQVYEGNGLTIEATLITHLSRERAADFYAEHRGKPFFELLLDFMTRGPVMALVLSGDDVIARIRGIHGDTDPANAAPGTVRARFGTSKTENAVHASATPEDAAREVPFYFPNLG